MNALQRPPSCSRTHGWSGSTPIFTTCVPLRARRCSPTASPHSPRAAAAVQSDTTSSSTAGNGAGTSGRSSAAADSQQHQQQHRIVVKYFDPFDPEHVVDVSALPQEAAPKLRPPPPPAAAGTGPAATVSSVAVSHSSPAAAAPAPAKDALMQKALVEQFEVERSKVAQLQQYEGLYRESRISSDRLKGEVAALQGLVSSKDAELARSYGTMAEQASERATLRRDFTANQDGLAKLNGQLAEARAMVQNLRALPAGGTSGTSSAPGVSPGGGARSAAQILAQMRSDPSAHATPGVPPGGIPGGMTRVGNATAGQEQEGAPRPASPSAAPAAAAPPPPSASHVMAELQGMLMGKLDKATKAV